MPESLGQLAAMMAVAGAKSLYAKQLAPNDNSKNQPYLGGDFTAIGILPFTDVTSHPGGKRPNYKARLDLSWIDETGTLWPAPGAQLILYPKYPEVRLSGFLRGCRKAPAQLMNVRDEGRILFLGVTGDGKIIAYAVGPDSPLAREFRANIDTFESVGVFVQLPLEAAEENPRLRLLEELARIHELGRIRACRLTRGGIIPYAAQNAAGTTLEAQLGILPNSRAAPDFEGWEVKAYAVNSFENIHVGRLTLMTPEPTAGLYRDEGLESFLRQYGRESVRGPITRLDFSGAHKAGARNPSTGLALEVRGFNPAKGIIEDLEGGLCLTAGDGTVAALWRFADLIRHWRGKHARAAYIPYTKQSTPLAYEYGSTVRLGEGTDPLRLIKAISDGAVIYDPGINIKISDGHLTQKKRSQFRILCKNLPSLYHRMEDVCCITPERLARP